jgi:hypothetical protein
MFSEDSLWCFKKEDPMKTITSINNTLKKLEEKQVKIKKEIESLSLKRNQKLVDLLDKLPPSTSIETIIGGLLHVIETIHQNSSKKEDWFKAGETFLSPKKSSYKGDKNPSEKS